MVEQSGSSTGVYTADLRGVGKLLSDEAAEARDLFKFHASDLLTNIASWHEADASGEYCETCWNHADDFRAAWPCDTYQAGMTLALQWLMRRPSGGGA